MNSQRALLPFSSEFVTSRLCSCKQNFRVQSNLLLLSGCRTVVGESRSRIIGIETTRTQCVQCYIYTLSFVLTSSSLMMAQEGPKHEAGKP